MKRKLVLKRLSASDLTLFEYQYRNTAGAKQKAINLDVGVFIGKLFPLLPSRLGEDRDRVLHGLDIYGPGGAPLHSVTRKVLKQQKNWRLNGELISNKPEEPYRYDCLKKDDYAILEFIGDAEPKNIKMYLVARENLTDYPLHAALEKEFGDLFSARKGMDEISPERLADMLNSLTLPSFHPVLDFVDSDVLEDASQGGFAGVLKLRDRRRGRVVSREELGRAKVATDRIGRLGEELLNSWLESSDYEKVEWVSDHDATAPYDFLVTTHGGSVFKIDAKSTAGDFRNPIHVSMAELVEMTRSDYRIYRLYSVSETSAKLRISTGMLDLANHIIGRLSDLPLFVTVDSVSIKPENVPFDPEIEIEFSD